MCFELNSLLTAPILIPHPRAIPSFSMMHAEKWEACNIEKLGMGLGTRLYSCYKRIITRQERIYKIELKFVPVCFLTSHSHNFLVHRCRSKHTI